MILADLIDHPLDAEALRGLLVEWAAELEPAERIVDLFAGPGGWSEGLRLGGLADLGLEWDAAACATRQAAGHRTIRADVAAVDPVLFAGLGVTGLIASPPCQTFSTAGKGRGRLLAAELAAAITDAVEGRYDETIAAHRARMAEALAADLEDDRRDAVDELGKLLAGPDPEDEEPGWRAATERALAAQVARDIATEARATVANATLVVEPARWAAALRPRWIALEQVPAVAPLWEVLGRGLRAQGYSVWTGELNAADFGVPQTRRRAILIARLDGPAMPPETTHAKRGTSEASLFGPALADWVTMAEALGWGMTERPAVTYCGSNEGGPDLAGGSGARATIERPKGRWHANALELIPGGSGYAEPNRRPYVAGEEPAPSVAFAFGHDASAWRWRERRNDQSGSGEVDPDWPLDRPATTVATRDLVPDPGANANRYNGNAKSRNDGYRVTIGEVSVLQSFRADYPWQGPRSKQFEQVGNAVPPVMAARVSDAAMGHPGAR